MSNPIATFFEKRLVDSLMEQSVFDKMVNGEIVGHRKKRVKKYLEFTVPTIEKHYHDDGDFEGCLLTTKTVYTKIVIGSEVITVPIYRKLKEGSTITFKRYSPLEAVRK